jgi:phage-related protein
MPGREVWLYREGPKVPALEWLMILDAKARQRCLRCLELLRLKGHELHRPAADYLRDGIYELRTKWRGINYRMLYFFHGDVAVVVSHGFAKQRPRVPELEIELALARRSRFQGHPESHTFRLES